MQAMADRLGDIETDVADLRTSMRELRGDVGFVRELLTEDRKQNAKLRERCVDALLSLVQAYTREGGPSRGLTFLTVVGIVSALLLVGSLTVADLQPLLDWLWAGGGPEVGP